MNSDYEKRLETEVDRELKALPELPAPETLARRVMLAVARQSLVPWYHRAWQMWPLPLRVAVFGALAAVFAAICFGGWAIPHSQLFATLARQLNSCLALPTTLWNALNAVAVAGVAAFKQLGTTFLIGCGLAVALAWAACFGLGAVCLRLAYAQK